MVSHQLQLCKINDEQYNSWADATIDGAQSRLAPLSDHTHPPTVKKIVHFPVILFLCTAHISVIGILFCR